jgi:hypothetical protein
MKSRVVAPLRYSNYSEAGAQNAMWITAVTSINSERSSLPPLDTNKFLVTENANHCTVSEIDEEEEVLVTSPSRGPIL